VKEKAASRVSSMNGSPDPGKLSRMFPLGDERSSSGASTRGGEGARVTPLETSACRLGRASAAAASEFVEGVAFELPVVRFSLGRSGSSLKGGLLGRSLLEELLGVLLALALAELFYGLLGELLAVLFPLEAALCNLGLSGGLSGALLLDDAPGLLPGELLAELLDKTKGCDVSFMACDAAARSSMVPSLTIVIVKAR
jgi:hypothetical protein